MKVHHYKKKISKYSRVHFRNYSKLLQNALCRFLINLRIIPLRDEIKLNQNYLGEIIKN